MKIDNVTSERLEALLMKSFLNFSIDRPSWRRQTSKQKYREFEKIYGPKILKYRPLPILPAGFAVLPFGCIWDKYEVNCIFVTKDFFRFIVLISESVEPMQLQELIPFLKKPELLDLSLFIR
ncbi:unnamed protein product [Cylicocyclus nassatus]|uniref:Uncharacterized protein n=1 Tax=Cylicocyclus nassatus TaxID=53992 RepID=A0AA36GIS7_CYLNA|nr:unnamed protein product [Cylicocyclus nassatus]